LERLNFKTFRQDLLNMGRTLLNLLHHLVLFPRRGKSHSWFKLCFPWYGSWSKNCSSFISLMELNTDCSLLYTLPFILALSQSERRGTRVESVIWHELGRSI